MKLYSYEYPHLWDDIYEKITQWWNGHPYEREHPTGEYGHPYIDCLWNLTRAYQAFQLQMALETARKDTQARIERERKKTGYITKRVAPHGYVAVTKPLARKLYEQGRDITICGNNVNAYHIFHGWHLGCTINIHQEHTVDSNNKPIDFGDIIQNYLYYLEPSMGVYYVYYVKYEYLL